MPNGCGFWRLCCTSPNSAGISIQWCKLPISVLRYSGDTCSSSVERECRQIERKRRHLSPIVPLPLLTIRADDDPAPATDRTNLRNLLWLPLQIPGLQTMMSSATFPKRHRAIIFRNLASLACPRTNMGPGKKKRRPSQLPLLQAEAEAASVSPSASPDVSPRSSRVPSPEHDPVSPAHSLPEQQLPSPALTPPAAVSVEDPLNNEEADDEARPDDLLDPALIGRTIKLVREDNWTEDIIHTRSQETKILYENQRG